MSKKIITRAKEKARHAGYMASWCIGTGNNANIWYDEKMNIVNGLAILEITDWTAAYNLVDAAFAEGMREEFQSRM